MCGVVDKYEEVTVHGWCCWCWARSKTDKMSATMVKIQKMGLDESKVYYDTAMTGGFYQYVYVFRDGTYF